MSNKKINCDCANILNILGKQSKNVLSDKLGQCSACKTGKHSDEVRSRISLLLK